jgi:hypothetical protein
MPDDLLGNIKLDLECAGRFTFASAQNAVPILRRITVENTGEEAAASLTLRLRAQPAFCREKSWTIDRIAADGSIDLRDKDLSIDQAFFSGLNEAERGELILSLEHDGVPLVEYVQPIELLARDEWGGLGEMAQILAAFIAPNDTAVERILKETGRILEKHGHRGALDGYQSGDPARAYMLTAAIWSAITRMALTYAEPPASFEMQGQKIRDPSRIATSKLATCLDTSLLLAAALEATGLNPIVIFTEGHAFTGVWLTDRSFNAIVEPDVTELRKAIAAR